MKDEDAPILIDTRSSERFNGLIEEPRLGVRRGKILNSINIPFNLLISSDCTMKTNAELANIF